MAQQQPTDPPSSQDEDALEVLVNQFADPMSFVRELVQNSIDAGSVEIDVHCEWRPAPANQQGTAVIHVDDFGHGMDRAIIETKLTRLFSSDKEGDLTKIGKFGIGFVSVFAIVPDAVCLDTGRSGESWRVLFRRDRSFSLIRLNEPVEGTQIQVIKRMTEDSYQSLVSRVRTALHFHCKHVDVALRFDGQPITEDFDLRDTLIKVRDQSDLADIVVAITPPEVPAIGGYYNRGLTLLELRSDVPRVAFKIQSNYLEHTLSRDNIVHDENFARIVARRDELVRGPLMLQLMQTIDTQIQQGAEPVDVLPYLTALAALVRHGCTAPPEGTQLRVATSPNGAEYSLPTLFQAAHADRLVHADAWTPLVEGLLQAGGTVCNSWQAGLVTAVYQARLAPPDSDAAEPTTQDSTDAAYAIERCFVRPLAFETTEPSQQQRIQALRHATLRLLQNGGEPTQHVALERLSYDGSSVYGQLAIVVEGNALQTTRLRSDLQTLSGTLVVDAEHKQLQPLLALSEREPELAAYALMKLCLLGHMTAERDSSLLSGAMEARWQRMRS